MSVLKVTVEGEVSSYEVTVDEDIADFNEFFKSLGNDPIIKSEYAILKTYLAWKLGLVKVGAVGRGP